MTQIQNKGPYLCNYSNPLADSWVFESSNWVKSLFYLIFMIINSWASKKKKKVKIAIKFIDFSWRLEDIENDYNMDILIPRCSLMLTKK